jgi:hypothetical protein
MATVEKNEATRRRFGHGDLSLSPMVIISVEDWRNPTAALDTLRQWAEREAADAIRWYLRDKATKRLAARILRALAIVLAVAGAVAPLLTAGTRVNGNWGYVLLGLAAGCLAFDHFFGLSSGWLRDMATAQALQRRLVAFRFAWVGANAEQALSSTYDANVKLRLGLIEDFVADLAGLVSAETGEWLAEFQSKVAKLPGGSAG